jgi:hypothetical protein
VIADIAGIARDRKAKFFFTAEDAKDAEETRVEHCCRQIGPERGEGTMREAFEIRIAAGFRAEQSGVERSDRNEEKTPPATWAGGVRLVRVRKAC